MSKLVRAISEDGGVVIAIIDSTEIVRQMQRIHQPSAPVTAALGRLTTAAALMGAMLKSTDDALTLRVKGGGPAGMLMAVANGKGDLKAYVENPTADVADRPDGKLNVGGVVGMDGTLSVVKDLGLKEPYVGQVPLVTGEIAEDLTSYYATSEQIPTVCALGVLVDQDLSVKQAGGFLLQLLPGATDAEIDQLERNIQGLPSMTQMLEQGLSVYEIIDRALAGFSPNILDEQPTVYHCDCNQKRVEQIYRSLGPEQLKQIAQEQETVELKCQFCNKAYVFKTADFI